MEPAGLPIAESTARGMDSFSAQEKSTISTDRARVDVAGEQVDQRTPGQGVGHQPVSQMGGLILRRGLELLRLFGS